MLIEQKSPYKTAHAVQSHIVPGTAVILAMQKWRSPPGPSARFGTCAVRKSRAQGLDGPGASPAYSAPSLLEGLLL